MESSNNRHRSYSSGALNFLNKRVITDKLRKQGCQLSFNIGKLHVSPAHLKALDHPAARPVRPSRGSLFIRFAPLPLCYAVGSSSRSLLTVAHSFPPPSFASVHVSRLLSASLRSVTTPASPLIPPPPKDRRTAPQGAPQTPPSKETTGQRCRLWQKTVGTSFFALLLLLLAVLSAAYKGEIIKGKIMQVKDGDTVVIEPEEGGAFFICRLYGIDTPEIAHGKKPGQPYGEEAMTELKRLVLGQSVNVELTGAKTYRREVCVIRKDSVNVNLEMVKRGYAWAYRQYLKRPYASEFIDAERDARSKHLGLWQQSNPQPPWDFRKKIAKRLRPYIHIGW